MQETKAQAPYSPVSHRDSCAGDQPGVLHCAQYLPVVPSWHVFVSRHLLVWLDSVDMLEHGQYHQSLHVCNVAQPIHKSLLYSRG